MLKLGIVGIVTMVMLALGTRAEAARNYYLVGLRHVYRISQYPDTRELDRQQIEENYAAAVKDAQDQYDADMLSILDDEARDEDLIHQDDRDAIQQNMEMAIADAEDERDYSLSQIYTQCDEVRENHSEFQLDQDGSYQVVGVDTAPMGTYEHVVIYRPYPLYLDPCPYGWQYGTTYTFTSFTLVIQTCHRTWISIGCPLFAPVYHHGRRFEVYAPVRREVVITRRGWQNQRPPAITVKEREKLILLRKTQVVRGVIHEPDYKRVRLVLGKPVDTRRETIIRSSGTSRYLNPPQLSTTRRTVDMGPAGAGVGGSRFRNGNVGDTSRRSSDGGGQSITKTDPPIRIHIRGNVGQFGNLGGSNNDSRNLGVRGDQSGGGAFGQGDTRRGGFDQSNSTLGGGRRGGNGGSADSNAGGRGIRSGGENGNQGRQDSSGGRIGGSRFGNGNRGSGGDFSLGGHTGGAAAGGNSSSGNGRFTGSGVSNSGSNSGSNTMSHGAPGGLGRSSGGGAAAGGNGGTSSGVGGGIGRSAGGGAAAGGNGANNSSAGGGIGRSTGGGVSSGSNAGSNGQSGGTRSNPPGDRDRKRGGG